jgi:Transglutaminase-like superfamily
MTAQRDALLHLLRDDDPATLRLLKTQLAQRGPAALPEMRALLALADPVAARQLRLVIAEIEANAADDAFAKFCAGFGPDGDLEDAAWRLAALFLPGEDFAPQRAQLDAWGREVARRLVKADSELDRIETLVEYLADEVGLRGNVEDYGNLNNSLLPEVIDTRLGLPITLSLVYILVGRRAGLRLSGAGLPGHFLVRYGPHFFDPFHGGAPVGLDECRVRAAQHGLALTPGTLQPYPAPQFLTRMLKNIHAIADKSDPPLAAKLAGWIEAIGSAS